MISPSVRVSSFASSDTFLYDPGAPNTPYEAITSPPLVIPTNVAVGDCLILAVAGQLDEISFPDITPDWTVLVDEPFLSGVGTACGLRVWWKTAEATDAGLTLIPGFFLATYITPGSGVLGAVGLLAYQNAGGGRPLVSAAIRYPSTGINLFYAPQLGFAPESVTVLEIYGADVASYPNGVGGTTMPMPETDEGQVLSTDDWYGSILAFCDFVQAAAGPAPLTPTTDSTTNLLAIDGVVVTIAIPTMVASYSPTLLTPIDNSTADLALPSTFTWQFNPSLNNGPQGAYAFRRKIVGAASYQYWDAATQTWGSSVVWNSSPDSQVTFPAGAWADGNAYNWSVATQDSISALDGAFALDATVTAQQSATVTVIAPFGFTTTFNPVIAWTATFPGAFVQIGYRAIIYSDTQYSAAGFTPGQGPSVFDTGVVAGTATSVPSSIPGVWNGHSMRAYVQVIETNDDASAFAFAPFLLEVDAPATPSLVAIAGNDPSTGTPIVTLEFSGADNELSEDDSTFEVSLGSWVAGANTSVAQETNPGEDGTHSLGLTAGGSGSVSAESGVYAVIP